MSAIAVGEITIIDLHDEDVHIGTTAPPDPKDKKLWLDTSNVPNVMKRWDAATQKWIKASPTEASDIGAETPSGAQGKADGARDAAKTYAGDILKDLADGSYSGGTFIDGKSVITPTVVGLQGTFADLLAGDPFGARLELGEDDGEPFLEAHDASHMRVALQKDELTFYDRGYETGSVMGSSSGPNMRNLLMYGGTPNGDISKAFLSNTGIQLAHTTSPPYVPAWIDISAINGIDFQSDVLKWQGSPIHTIGIYGSNANGSYVCWSNGLQVCWRIVSKTGTVASAWGSWFYISFGQYAFAASFKEIPACAAMSMGDVGLALGSFGGTTTHFPVVEGYRPVSQVSSVVNKVGLIAIGWWK